MARKRELESQLNAVRARISRTKGQNNQIKRLVGCLNVCKDDFTQLHAPPNGKQEEAMLAVGSRLLNSLCPPDVIASHSEGHNLAGTRASQILQSQHPEEAQVAAAALVACGNDPAAAIVALMEAAERVQNA
ncbi:hypothetical protein QBZ16_002372 [Prototheca wickerhamii]|uniref:Uncharacterized protein n=1 Tax=Prototheca wickerhamii TaxID=3111 RepID=A0AAD9IPA9_PROWI|nr:hypothetical protein QBZ16_002372 [Prototheca wickerhamii]